jgi:hypothetical protein
VLTIVNAKTQRIRPLCEQKKKKKKNQGQFYAELRLPRTETAKSVLGAHFSHRLLWSLWTSTADRHNKDNLSTVKGHGISNASAWRRKPITYREFKLYVAMLLFAFRTGTSSTVQNQQSWHDDWCKVHHEKLPFQRLKKIHAKFCCNQREILDILRTIALKIWKPGTRASIDESMWKWVVDSVSTVSMPRKPNPLGILVYFLCFMSKFAKTPLVYDVEPRFGGSLNCPTPGDAYAKLVQRVRGVNGPKSTLVISADSAFSTKFLRW